VLAATFLGEIGDIRRFQSKHQFAAHTGTAPLEASSSQVVRHRLSRAGDRKLNHALCMVAMVQVRRPSAGQAYHRRRLAEGKSSKEALRCLKRRLSDAVYRCLVADQPPDGPQQLRTERTSGPVSSASAWCPRDRVNSSVVAANRCGSEPSWPNAVACSALAWQPAAPMDTDVWNQQGAQGYDESSAHKYAPEVLGPTVDFLAQRAGGGPALEFAIGTGCVALPLRARGVPVAGIDLEHIHPAAMTVGDRGRRRPPRCEPFRGKWEKGFSADRPAPKTPHVAWFRGANTRPPVVCGQSRWVTLLG
jgi:hypothetical protein